MTAMSPIERARLSRSCRQALILSPIGRSGRGIPNHSSFERLQIRNQVSDLGQFQFELGHCCMPSRNAFGKRFS